MYVPLYLLWNKPTRYFTPCLSSLLHDKLEQLKARNKLGGNEILEELDSQFTVTQLKRNGEAHLQKMEELM